MFNSLGWPELVVLLVIGLFVVGPDRLPGVAAQAGRALRSLRTYGRRLRDDLADDLGPEIRQVDLRSLSNPRAFLVKHVLADEPRASTRRAGTAAGARGTGTAPLPVPQQPGEATRPSHDTSERQAHGELRNS